MIHKGNQKRIYFEGARYFVTFNTSNRITYFSEPLLCEVFILSLYLSKFFYNYDLYAFVILLDHGHILFLPHKSQDLSKVMRYIKRHTARNINFVLGYSSEEEIGQSLLRLGDKYCKRKTEIENYNKKLVKLRQKFVIKYGLKNNIYPKFSWQRSFLDHYIRNDKDFDQHISYIYNNPFKHDILNSEKYQYIFTNYPDLITQF